MSLLVVTGAGISLASGIPTFRGTDPNAVWANDVMEKGTLSFYHRNPTASWLWYRERFLLHQNVRPNASHVALAVLEKHNPDMLVVTQNVDTLHEQAGSKNLIKVHGSIDKVRCSRVGCANGAPNGLLLASEVDFTAFQANPSVKTLPRCQICGKLIRPHVLWFDEYYNEHKAYEYQRAIDFLFDTATEVWFLGTSMAVGITNTIQMHAVGRELPITVVNPTPGLMFAETEATIIRERVEDWLPQEVARRTGEALQVFPQLGSPILDESDSA